MFVDTHCHIHDQEFFSAEDAERAYQNARDAGVTKMLVVGTSEPSSAAAVKFAEEHDGAYAVVGVHPHDSKDGYGEIEKLAKADGVVAVGEIGLDYFYTHSPREVQLEALEAQIQIALDNGLPIAFHVREAFDDFWPVFDNFRSASARIRGVLHSFTDNQENLDRAFANDLFVGINGISTFTRDEAQKKLYTNIPLERMVLETDAPFLAPVPHRGSTNEPKRIVDVAEFHAKLRGISVEELAHATTKNAMKLFGLNQETK